MGRVIYHIKALSVGRHSNEIKIFPKNHPRIEENSLKFSRDKKSSEQGYNSMFLPNLVLENLVSLK